MILCINKDMSVTVQLSGFTCYILFIFFFKQKTAYEMRISDWSSDVCSSDLLQVVQHLAALAGERKAEVVPCGRRQQHRDHGKPLEAGEAASRLRQTCRAGKVAGRRQNSIDPPDEPAGRLHEPRQIGRANV